MYFCMDKTHNTMKSSQILSVVAMPGVGQKFHGRDDDPVVLQPDGDKLVSLQRL